MLPLTSPVRSLLLLLALACGGAAGATSSPSQQGGEEAPPLPLESWQSDALGLRLTPPRGWVSGPGPTAESVTLQPSRGGAQIALLSLPLAADGPGPNPTALAEAAIASLRQKVEHFKLLESRDSEVAGLAARELYFRGRVQGEKFRWVQTVFVRNAHQVIVMYAAPEERFERYLGDYDQTLRSIRAAP